MRHSTTLGRVSVALLLSWAILLVGSAQLVEADQILDAAGPEKWIDGPQNVQVGSDRVYPDVAVAPDGTRIHVWAVGGTGFSGREVFLRRFDGEGVPLDDPQQVNTTTDDTQSNPRVAVSANGSFLVIFQSYELEPGTGAERVVVRCRAYRADGTPRGPEQQVSTVWTNASTDNYADVAALRTSGGGAGGYAIVWFSRFSAGSDTGWSIQGAIVSAAGVPGAQFQVNSTDQPSQNYPSVVELNDGGFLAIWTNDKQVWGRRFNSAGGPIGNDFQISTSAAVNRYDTDAAIGWHGNIAVVWSDADAVDTGKEIHARLYDGDLNPLGPDFRVNTLTTGAQEDPRVADYGPFGFLVVWHSDEASGTDLGNSIEARLITGSNTFGGPQVQFNVWDNNNNQQSPGAHGWYGRAGTAWRSLTWDGNPPPVNMNTNFMIGRDVEGCIFCDDLEWFQPDGSGNHWRWAGIVGATP